MDKYPREVTCSVKRDAAEIQTDIDVDDLAEDRDKVWIAGLEKREISLTRQNTCYIFVQKAVLELRCIRTCEFSAYGKKYVCILFYIYILTEIDK